VIVYKRNVVFYPLVFFSKIELYMEIAMRKYFSFLVVLFHFTMFKIGYSREPSYALREFSGQSSAYSGGGSAGVFDSSAAQVNPAGLALVKELAVGGQAMWRGENIQYSEASVHDSSMSEISASFLARWSTKNAGGKDRSFSLGLAERFGDSGWLLGLGGQYFQVENTPEEKLNGKKKYSDVVSIRAGVIYVLSESLAVAAASGGYFDKFQKEKHHQVGLALGFAQHFTLTADSVFYDTTWQQVMSSLSISAKQFLDLRVSYGYELPLSQHFGAVGFEVKSDKVRLNYNLSKESLSSQRLTHTVGVTLMVGASS
jgi:hypothetical protein